MKSKNLYGVILVSAVFGAILAFPFQTALILGLLGTIYIPIAGVALGLLILVLIGRYLR